MTVIKCLETLDPQTNVRIDLREKATGPYPKYQMIADTTAEVLIQSPKESFRNLNVVSTVRRAKGIWLVVER